MKTQLLSLALFGLLVQIPVFAQDVTTVNATSNEISDNLDLRAVASIFGDSQNLEDFERQLNDPRNKISNLDLNFDRKVDYLRVIEAVEQNTHLIILQAVLEKDVFQDVATIEVERDQNNQVQIQVVGDVFMYGPNYIYEPVYVRRPIIYNVFWVNNYNPYFSPYYFNYYPTYYAAWAPYPVYRYRRNVNVHINQYNYYNYSNHRRSTNAVALHETRRSNGYERRNYSASNSTRNTISNNNNATTRNNGVRSNNSSTRTNAGNSAPRNRTRTEINTNVRNTNTVRNTTRGTRTSKSDSSIRQNIAQQPQTTTRQINQPSKNTRNTKQVNSTRTNNTNENTGTRGNGNTRG